MATDGLIGMNSNVSWETVGEYMDTLDKRLGVNVGTLIGHSAVRHYVMGNDCQGRAATPNEVEAMRGIVRDGMTAGALGFVGVPQPRPLRSAGRAHSGDLG